MAIFRGRTNHQTSVRHNQFVHGLVIIMVTPSLCQIYFMIAIKQWLSHCLSNISVVRLSDFPRIIYSHELTIFHKLLRKGGVVRSETQKSPSNHFIRWKYRQIVRPHLSYLRDAQQLFPDQSLQSLQIPGPTFPELPDTFVVQNRIVPSEGHAYAGHERPLQY